MFFFFDRTFHNTHQTDFCAHGVLFLQIHCVFENVRFSAFYKPLAHHSPATFHDILFLSFSFKSQRKYLSTIPQHTGWNTRIQATAFEGFRNPIESAASPVCSSKLMRCDSYRERAESCVFW